MKEIIKIDIPKGYEFAGVDDDKQHIVFTKVQTENIAIIIDGLRYDAELLENASTIDVCKYCDLYNGKETSECLKLNACPLPNGYIFKKSTKSFER